VGACPNPERHWGDLDMISRPTGVRAWNSGSPVNYGIWNIHEFFSDTRSKRGTFTIRTVSRRWRRAKFIDPVSTHCDWKTITFRKRVNRGRWTGEGLTTSRLTVHISKQDHVTSAAHAETADVSCQIDDQHGSLASITDQSVNAYWLTRV
jgi:hypothetical protein